ncbi:MAG: efflux RND transporter periplasmic adaptor subunit [Proteobacteria bacterium]|nr:efflux RND transporter periplasmic adaptor subunit [Pseudomonadota bacterium]
MRVLGFNKLRYTAALLFFAGLLAYGASGGNDEDHGQRGSSAHAAHAHAAEAHAAHAHAEDSQDAQDIHGKTTVTISRDHILEFGLKVATAGHGRIATEVVLPGEVVPNADRVAHLVPRYAGIVKEVRSRIGDTVAAGDVLAIIESSESLSSYGLSTLTNGTVIDKHITRGEAVTRQTQAFVIADLGNVWIELSVYQRDLASVKVGQSVLVSLGHDQADTRGTISYVSPVVDEETRTARARVVLDNSTGKWRPGMFVTGRVDIASVEVAVAVPNTAFQTVDEHSVVFVQRNGAFEPRQLELGRRSTTHAEVLSGISSGETYVASGGFILKAELGRSELDQGHGH